MLRAITGLGRKRKPLGVLFKEGWHQIPEVMAASILGMVGLAGTLYALNTYIKEDMYHARYRMFYVVYRPDDPNAKYIRKPTGDEALP